MSNDLPVVEGLYCLVALIVGSVLLVMWVKDERQQRMRLLDQSVDIPAHWIMILMIVMASLVVGFLWPIAGGCVVFYYIACHLFGDG